MKKTNKGRIAAVLAAMVMMTGCGNNPGNTASEISPESGNLAGSKNAEKTEVEYVNRFDEEETKKKARNMPIIVIIKTWIRQPLRYLVRALPEMMIRMF